MFERFTEDARQAVRQAVEEARRLRHGQAGTEHLLLGLLSVTDSASARLLAARGVDRERVRTEILRIRGNAAGGEIDAEALETIGIDLSAVRRKVEEAFGPGALDHEAPRGRRGIPAGGRWSTVTPRSKKVLELALREAVALKSKEIRDGHILLGIIREGEGLGVRVLADAGVNLVALREDVKSHLAGAGRQR
ncbi:Clp protease N-terminal domain-containing protein [Microbispora sp. H10670]|uniref:Clp protease N-terminal domain-containing protein n=1 Tax=Microbispora sp. H10670 TaxID=2729108 RepID=UPI001602AFD0|nr:Clp protease N-terminal domain-containing protein [Microbispora sp. H10670]